MNEGTKPTRHFALTDSELAHVRVVLAEEAKQGIDFGPHHDAMTKTLREKLEQTPPPVFGTKAPSSRPTRVTQTALIAGLMFLIAMFQLIG